MQLNLTFLEMPNPTAVVWDKLDEENRLVVLEVLARLIAFHRQLPDDVDRPGAREVVVADGADGGRRSKKLGRHGREPST